jgi:hypothetical protein
MPHGSPSSEELTVEELSDVSLRLVRELGFMRSTLGDTGLGPSGIKAVFEIGRTPGILARDLGDRIWKRLGTAASPNVRFFLSDSA